MVTAQGRKPRKGTQPAGVVSGHASGTQGAGLCEGCRISNPVRSPIRVGVDSKFGILSGHSEIVAASSGSRCCGATEADWLATLQGENSVDAPAADYLIRKPARLVAKCLPLPNGRS